MRMVNVDGHIVFKYVLFIYFFCKLYKENIEQWAVMLCPCQFFKNVIYVL